MDGRYRDVVRLEYLKNATGGVQLRQIVVDAYRYHEWIEVLHLGNCDIVLAAVDLYSKSDGPGRNLRKISNVENRL